VISFKNWLEQNSIIQEFNCILKEYNILIPKLEIKIKDINNLEQQLKQNYAKEVGIQSRYGGIRNPPTVLINKIRHIFTNYEEIREFLDINVENGNIQVCEEISILENLFSRMKQLVITIINSIKYPFVVDNIPISREQLIRSNDYYFKKETEKLIEIKKKCDYER
jgi:hypothetical protein